MKCFNHLFVFYFVNLCWDDILFVETVKTFSSRKTPKIPVFLKYFLELSFIAIHIGHALS